MNDWSEKVDAALATKDRQIVGPNERIRNWNRNKRPSEQTNPRSKRYQLGPFPIAGGKYLN